jgi:hypothetical protein
MASTSILLICIIALKARSAFDVSGSEKSSSIPTGVTCHDRP